MKHEDGFESEAKFHQALGFAYKRYNGFQSCDLKQIIAIFDPSITEKLFERKECKRWLKNIDENSGFTKGKFYESITFNGATYEIANDDGKIVCIGSCYFEWMNIISN